MASRNNRSGGSEPTWCRVLFYIRRLVLVYQPSRRAGDSATVDYRFRGHGSLAKSGPGSDGVGNCRGIFLAKPFLQPVGLLPLVDCYLTDYSIRRLFRFQRWSSVLVNWISNSIRLRICRSP